MFILAQNYLNRGFWGDEAWTSLISQLPYSQMLKTTAADFHPPGYYTVVEILYKVLPPTEVNTRLVSIAFYLLTLFMVYKLASYVRGHLFGGLSALVVALNPIFFRYAFEARNYTMFAFLATGSAFYLIELSKKFTNARALMFVLFTTLGIYTHYYMFFILGAQGLYLLLFDRKIFIKMMGLYTVCAILYVPWLKSLIGQLTSVKGSYWIAAVDWRHTHFEAFLRILGGEQQGFLRDILFPLSLILLLGGFVYHLLKRKFEKPYILIWLWAIAPFVLATLPGLKVDGVNLPFRPIFFWRYLIGSSIPLSMVMVHAAQKFNKHVSIGALAALIILSGVIDVQTFGEQINSFREQYRETIVPQIKPDDRIVTILPSFAEVLYYKNRTGLNNELVVLPEGLVQFSGKSLLDAYVANGVVKIDDAPSRGVYFKLEPGPTVNKIYSQGD